MTGFGLDHLPYGVFSVDGGPRRVGVRFEDPAGDWVLDLFAATGRPEFDSPSLNAFLALGTEVWRQTRDEVRDLAEDGGHAVPLADATLHLPVEVADYVDFYASLDHATNVGRMFRPDGDALTPNWRHLPIGYHGRAGTVVVSGTPVVRPSGQRVSTGSTTNPGDRAAPTFGPSQRLDIEAELGFVVGAPSPLGEPVPFTGLSDHVFGVTGLNDWSARDIQAWEYVPLGPFLGKSFATSISPWVTPLAALEAAWVELPAQDPEPLPYLGHEGVRHRRRGRAERRGGQPPAVLLDVLVARTDARPPHRQRRLPAHRRPVRVRHHQRTRAGAARLVPRAVVGRCSAVHGRRPGAVVPPGRRRGGPEVLGALDLRRQAHAR